MSESIRINRHKTHTALVRLVLVATALVALFAIPTAQSVRADDGCDSTEDVACIPLPAGDSSTDPTQSGAPAANSAGPMQSAAAAVPCPSSGCCFSSGGVIPPSSASAALPNIPAPACAPVPPPNFCLPGPMPAYGSPANSPSVAVPVPAPVPINCSPYRGIYATINLGNAADVRALRTLSTQGLSSYWRQGALSQIQSQVAQLQLADAYASTHLYSIQVQDSSFSAVNRTATVHTLEHWLYQQRSLDDGSVQLSQDEWVDNEYDLNLNGNAWYITYNSATLTGGPDPVPLPASGG